MGTWSRCPLVFPGASNRVQHLEPRANSRGGVVSPGPGHMVSGPCHTSWVDLRFSSHSSGLRVEILVTWDKRGRKGKLFPPSTA